MATFLYVLSVLLFFMAVDAANSAASSVHQIFSAVLGLAAIAAISAGGVISAINRLRESVERSDRNAWSMGRHLSQILQHPEKDHGDPGEAPKA